MTKFEDLPAEVRDIIADEAKKHGVEVSMLFPDFKGIQAANKARRAAICRLVAAGVNPTGLASVFGVSRVAINHAVRTGA